ncbi:MAG: hypothetical protein KBS96_06975 [Lachnospiraceae bacterium]|nr:hypothetical protein [Candidatus Colinaster scatohippi]
MRNVLHEQFESVIVYPSGKSQYRQPYNSGSDRIIKKGDNTEKRGDFEELLAASIKQFA